MKRLISLLLSTVFLNGCHKGDNSVDPYESMNRQTFKFNRAIDATLFKPPARFYVAVMPTPIRKGVTNFLVNLNMIPTIINDVLQVEVVYTLKDSWRLLINSSFGVLGLFDVAENMGLPPRSNDVGITFAKWGYKPSAYIVLPILGPSTFRDGVGLIGDYVISPFPLSLFPLRFLDIRAELLESEKLLAEAIDPYSFTRDAWLQHREYAINNEVQETPADGVNSLYVPE